jgi:predicted nicotinamide N-methyase
MLSTAVSVPVVVGGLTLDLLRPTSAEDLIDEDAYAVDERLPYWAELWPSARVLADVLAEAPLEGLRVVELGCGLGLPSIVALARGATVLATDWYDDALAFARENAMRALGQTLETMAVDWRDPPDRLLQLAPFDLVVAADVLYEERNAAALGELLPYLTAPGSEVVIADPRRPHAALLWPILEKEGWTHSKEDVTLDAHIDEAGPVIHLHRLETTRRHDAQDAVGESDTLG